MSELCVSIPKELLCYKIAQDGNALSKRDEYKSNISIVKDSCGKIQHIDYYTTNGNLSKRIIYKGSTIIGKQHYRNGLLYISEDYRDNLLISKKIFNKLEQPVSQIHYEYNRERQLTGIRKIQNLTHYRIQYGYDQLNRVNSRTIWINTDIVEEQIYNYDIFDRIIEYKDQNQHIVVNKIGSNNELISYTITDKVGNQISITNNLTDNEYSKTDVLLNGHSITVNDKNYMDNIMLKKPYTSEDDLDLTITNIIRTKYTTKITQRSQNDTVTSSVINTNLQKGQKAIR